MSGRGAPSAARALARAPPRATPGLAGPGAEGPAAIDLRRHPAACPPEPPLHFLDLWPDDLLLRRPPDAARLALYRELGARSADLRGLTRVVGQAIPSAPAVALPVARALDPTGFGELVVAALPGMGPGWMAGALDAAGLGEAATPALLRAAQRGERSALATLDHLGAVGPERWWYARDHAELLTASGPARCAGLRQLGVLTLAGALVVADAAGLPAAPALPGVEIRGKLGARCPMAELAAPGARPAALILEAARLARREAIRFAPARGADGGEWRVRVDTATVAACAEATARRLSPKRAASLASDLAAALGPRGGVVGCASGAGDGACPVAIGRDPEGAVRVVVVDLLPRG